MQTVVEQEVINIRDAARLFGVHENTVRNWIDRGYLQARVLPSGHRRVDAAQVRELLKQITNPLLVQSPPPSEVLHLD